MCPRSLLTWTTLRLGAAGFLIDLIIAINCYDPEKPRERKGKVVKAAIMLLLNVGVMTYWWWDRCCPLLQIPTSCKARPKLAHMAIAIADEPEE